MIMQPIALQRQQAPAASLLVQRTFDILIAGVAMVLLAPLLALVAVALLLEGGPPILFAQIRVGVGGQPFRMYKFRKFRPDCGTDGCPLTLDGDCRLTRIGQFLARTKIDELPQLWNVLRGEMSIVGPRPESLDFVNCFCEEFEEVLRYRPGLIGPSQVAFRNERQFYPRDKDPTQFYRDVLFPAKARLDLAYFSHRTVASDIAWMIRGALAVLGWVPPIGTALAERERR
ncbi:lipopolysaccharide/colanic/teichoic acid biosynthesis glycosyltransferase [Mycoplana sp. BE70]|uniref:sugar transferase n=1 Tax=Mycoplana sp. BE70 TaxID=2817775 RepID=UPI002858D2DD|nr:sugar transferase [Mycoplana sp. BE70]MDR6756389.1 lipopolysaccharide/colanic/teichoic acid biosynthesis glycosyltransferase [Mycoplana sp. BE70]